MPVCMYMYVRVYHCMCLSVTWMHVCVHVCMSIHMCMYGMHVCMHGCNWNEYPDCVKHKEYTLQALKLVVCVQIL